MTSPYVNRPLRSPEQAFAALHEQDMVKHIQADLESLERRMQALVLNADHEDIISAGQEASGYVGDALSVIGGAVKEMGLRDFDSETERERMVADREAAFALRRGE